MAVGAGAALALTAFLVFLAAAGFLTFGALVFFGFAALVFFGDAKK